MSDSNRDEEVLPFLLQHGETIKRTRLFSSDSPLYNEQQEALEKIISWFSDPTTTKSTSVVVMPTGSGKTGVMCCLPYMFGSAVEENKINLDLSKPILIIAPGLAILKQLEKSFCLNAQNDSPFLFSKNVLKISKDKRRFYYTDVIRSTKNVSTLETTVCDISQVVLTNAQKWRAEGKLPNYAMLPDNLFSVVIVDEAHHLPAEQWKRIVRHFESHAKVIFFTATPQRHDGREITDDRDISRTQDYTYRLERDVAIKSRLIRDVKFDDELYARFYNGDVKLAVLRAIRFKLEEKNRLCSLPGNRKHAAILITKNISAAEEVHSLCKTISWDHVKIVHSENHKKQQDIIKDIATNNYDLLIIVMMLLEGFDHPPLSVAGILTNIESRVKFSQFIGRIQRVIRHPELERESTTADIITAPEFNQRVKFEEYKLPKIVEELELDDDEQ